MHALIPFPDISPEIFSISLFGMTFALRWYALAYIVGILAGWRMVLRAANTPRLWRDQTPVMTANQIEDLLTWVILGVILGGRMGYVLFYQPGFYLSNPSQILKVWEGGMSFHGGALGVIIAAFLYTGRYNIPRISAGDLIALGIAPGLLLGRIANFINAELWGRPTDLPWGVAFPTQAAQTCTDVVGLCARHPSQLYEAFLEGVILFAVLLWVVYRRGWLKIPGQTIGLFFAGYGLSRFIVEYFRQPDLQFFANHPRGYAVWLNDSIGLTMGQILSLPMVLLGLALIVFVRRAAR